MGKNSIFCYKCCYNSITMFNKKAVMAYNMGNAGAERAWENGVTSTEHSEKVMEAMARWEAVVG